MHKVSARLVAWIVAGSCLALGACDGEEDVSPPARGESDSATPDTPEAPVTPDMDSPEVTGEPAAAQTAAEAQASMNQYVSNLNETNEILADVDNAVEAAAASPQIAPIVDRLKAFKAKWDEMDPATKKELTNTFRDQLQPALDTLNQHIERISNDPAFGDQIRSLLGEIPRIEI